MTEIAKAYGDTLYDLAVESGEVERMLEEINTLRQAFEENPQFITLMNTPTMSKAERVAVVEETFGGKLHIYLLNFLKIIADNGTAREFIDAAKEFRSRYNWENGIVQATVISAVPLSDAQESSLVEKLNAVTGKTVRLDKKVNPSCVGGVRLLMDGVQMDGTVKNKLDAIRTRLLGVLA
ncbi:MAG: ATP synthase F1 subunit delta [Eubacteriales bacterium]|nr:ATP synthase F1 subunit delta [Eubacteriales bacterium]